MAKTTDDNIVELNEIQSRSMIESAMKVGSYLAQDDAVQELLHNLADFKDATKRGPVSALLLIEPILKKAKVWDNLPVPNTSSGNNPGKWKSQVRGKGKAGNMVTKQYDYYREMIKALPEVSGLITKMEQFDKVLSGDDVSGVPDDVIALDASIVTTKRQNCQSRINTILTNVKKGIQVRLHMDRIKAEFPGVSATFLYTFTDKAKKKREIVSNPKCILVGDASMPDQPITTFKTYDADGFVGLDLDVAAANGGTYVAVTKSSKKVASEPETQLKRIVKYDDLLPYLYEVSAYVANTENWERVRVVLKDAKRNAAHKNDLALVAFDQLRGDLTGLLSGMDTTIREARARVEDTAAKVAANQ